MNTNGRHSLHLVKWAALSVGTMIVLSYLVGFVHHHPSQPTHAAMLTKAAATAKPVAAAA
jgi:hypothetical protein